MSTTRDTTTSTAPGLGWPVEGGSIAVSGLGWPADPAVTDPSGPAPTGQERP